MYCVLVAFKDSLFAQNQLKIASMDVLALLVRQEDGSIIREWQNIFSSTMRNIINIYQEEKWSKDRNFWNTTSDW